MSGWLGFLIFAVLFFLMMRTGCGAHMSHGGHSHGSNHHDGSGTDPVCGMTVEPDKGFSKYHEGRLLRFCSKSCLDKFELSPAKYLASDTGEAHGHHH